MDHSAPLRQAVVAALPLVSSIGGRLGMHDLRDLVVRYLAVTEEMLMREILVEWKTMEDHVWEAAY